MMFFVPDWMIARDLTEPAPSLLMLSTLCVLLGLWLCMTSRARKPDRTTK